MSEEGRCRDVHTSLLVTDAVIVILWKKISKDITSQFPVLLIEYITLLIISSNITICDKFLKNIFMESRAQSIISEETLPFLLWNKYGNKDT